MTITTNTGRKSTGLGARILQHLAKHGPATAKEIAKALKASVREVSARCWWLAAKEQRLSSKGEGRAKLYSLPRQPRSRQEASAEQEPAKATPEAPKRASAQRRQKGGSK